MDFAGLPLLLSADIWGGTIWQVAACHAGELAIRASARHPSPLSWDSLRFTTEADGGVVVGRGVRSGARGQSGRHCVTPEDERDGLRASPGLTRLQGNTYFMMKTSLLMFLLAVFHLDSFSVSHLVSQK